MRRTSPHLTLTAAAVALSLSLVCVTGAQAATAKTVTACVNKKSGTTKVLSAAQAKKKCAKGWSKVTWNVAGTNGTNGKNGTNGTNGANGTNGTNGTNGVNSSPLTVHNADGSVLGTFGSILPFPPVSIISVFVDGGYYNYFLSGQVAPYGSSSPVFKTNSCAGTAYVAGDLPSYNAIYSKLSGGPSRIAYRASTGSTFGPVRAWKFTTTHESVTAINTYELSATGTCGPTNPPTTTGELITLASVPAPPDGIGPLTIS